MAYIGTGVHADRIDDRHPATGSPLCGGSGSRIAEDSDNEEGNPHELCPPKDPRRRDRFRDRPRYLNTGNPDVWKQQTRQSPA
ncbi:hypothetical protein [Streptomyces scabiei]|uniref:hypothetical protein n=1 Tax=Streptomyces scabiei TaxID=1930 RepID=UPI0029B96698|nr:hypothetical protein [Streptomyces scabiei]MDX3114126.1 hypothetical protein [Streptomyces scabiei]